MRLVRTRVDLPRIGEALDGRLGMNRVAVDDHGQRRVEGAGMAQHRLGVGQSGFVELVRLRYPRQEVPQPVVLGIQAPSHHVEVGTRWAHS